MNVITPPPPGGTPRYHAAPQMPQFPQIPTGLALLGLIPLLAILGACYWWFVQRYEVRLCTV